MSETAVTRTSERAGPPVSSVDHESIHPLVKLTSMHGTFVLEAVCDWVRNDQARQEEGIADSLEYLTGAMRFLMTATARTHDFSKLCRSVSGSEDANLKRMEATLPVLKEVGIDTTGMEKMGDLMRFRASQLGAIANAHDGNANQTAELFKGLETRINAILAGHSPSLSTRRPN